ncbi:uncharacterized protein KIAA1143 homolog [Ambystoma mexicanum]|uniref:uncharacterized protein KIAA1143 homolog n=1 Tax=Ambystoma mexicanum TaxID=8296 RepID=UPI0037E9C6E3
MSKKNQVSYVRPAEPAFLTKFKKDVGFKEGPDVETKRQELPAPGDCSDGSDKEDEEPQIVVLKEGDLTAEEVKELKLKVKGDSKSDDEPISPDGKIMFRKPVKRSSDEQYSGLSTFSNKKKKQEERKKKRDLEAAANTQKQVRNSSLLSFGDEEDDD